MQRFILTVFLLCASLTGFAQQINITGVVKDASTGETVIGASVLVKGTTTGTVTSLDGEFSINVKAGQDIVVSSLGYDTYTFKATEAGRMVITLKASTEFLDDVVVVGYGSTTKANLTGAVDQVTSEVFAGRPSSNATQMLVGAIPNLNITLSDGKPSRSAEYNIRGTTSIGGGGSALVLIDGVEGDPALLNPEDIESVSVLKDAASASIYGSRATFGVVLITTKNASKDEGKFNFNYSGNVSFLSPCNLPDIVDDGYVYANLFQEAYHNYYGYNPSGFNKTLDFSQSWLSDFYNRKVSGITEQVALNESGNYVYYGNTNYYDIVYKPYTLSHTHNLSVSGNTGKLNYYLSGRLYQYDGIINFNPDKYRTMSLRGKATAHPFEWLTIWENIAFNYEYNHIPASHNQEGGSNFLRAMQDNGHVNSVPFNQDGTLTKSGAYAIGGLVTGDNYTDKIRNQLTTTTGVKAEFFEKTLRFNVDFTYKSTWYNNTKKNTMVSYSTAPNNLTWIGTPGVDDYMQESWQRSGYMSTNAYVEYANKWNDKHDFKALLGYNYERSVSKIVELMRYGLISNDVESLQLEIGRAHV